MASAENTIIYRLGTLDDKNGVEIDVESDAQGSPPRAPRKPSGASDSKRDTEKPEPGIVLYNMPPTVAQRDIEER